MAKSYTFLVNFVLVISIVQSTYFFYSYFLAVGCHKFSLFYSSNQSIASKYIINIVDFELYQQHPLFILIFFKKQCFGISEFSNSFKFWIKIDTLNNINIEVQFHVIFYDQNSKIKKKKITSGFVLKYL